MIWSDEGVVLSSKKHGENYRIVNILTKDHGKNAGFISINNRRNTFSILSNVVVDFSKKNLNDSFGFWNKKFEQQNWIYILNHNIHISVFQSICALLDYVLPIGVKYPKIFEFLFFLTKNSKRISSSTIVEMYAYFEFFLLREIGFGFDLKECGICGRKEPLYFLSPKTGRAASKKCALNYKEKLFVIPDIWHHWQNLSSFSEILLENDFVYDLKKTTDITWHFLSMHIPSIKCYFRDTIMERKLLNQ